MHVHIESTKYVLLQDNYDAIMTAVPSDIQEMQRAIWPSTFMTNLINPKSQPKGNLYSLSHIRAPIMIWICLSCHHRNGSRIEGGDMEVGRRGERETNKEGDVSA